VNLPFASETFDVVITTGVLHQAKNVNEYEAAIKELSRVMKPNGLVCLNIFTSLVLDESYLRLSDAFVFQTKEGLEMTLLSKTTFYELMLWYGLVLEEELSEDVVEENTGKRSVLRCNFVKVNQII
jgi:ubiquinone/menaquinone biosynthesis C-methylase UbiE